VTPSRSLPIVAIDGPAGAGKSSIARRLADSLGFLLVDTGAIYRALALAAQREGLALADGPAVTALANALVSEGALVFRQVSIPPPPSSTLPTEVKLTPTHPDVGGVRVYLRGEDVSDAIRSPAVSLGASVVASHPGVRVALLDLQRAQGLHGGVVLEGRDIGTVVFPDAEVKFFLTAAPEVRAQRRYEELLARGKEATFETTLADVHKRDDQDMKRAVAPLRQADDAVVVDSSHMTLDQAVDHMAQVVRSRMFK
jgi:cytidylate kinase